MSEILGLDISLYQEYGDWGLIDWPALKSDPRNFRFIWIKCQEGSCGPTSGCSYDMEVVVRQVAGAQSVGFEAVNLYHYYLYQFFNVATDQWQVIDARLQAQAFYDTWMATGLQILHPTTDCEDPSITKFLQFYDTPSANKALEFARKLNFHLEKYHASIYALFGVRPDIYTGWWWLKLFCNLLINNGFGHELDWMKDYKFILADYDGELNIPPFLRNDQVIAWQMTSTPLPPVQGIPTGHVVPGDALDIDKWMLTEAEFLAWCKGEIMTTVIYNQNVPMSERSFGNLWTEDDARITDMDVYNQSEFAVVHLGGKKSNPDHSAFIGQDSGWTIRAREFHNRLKKVIGRYHLSVDYYMRHDVEKDDVDTWNFFDNPFGRSLVYYWRQQEIMSSEEWDRVSATDPEWVHLDALSFLVYETSSFNGPINSLWQVSNLNLIDQTRALMVGGKIPNIPILVYSNCSFLTSEGVSSWLTARSNWLQLIVAQPVAGLSTATVPSLSEMSKRRPSDSFNFAALPAGFASRVLFHQYTSDYIYQIPCTMITDSNGNARPVSGLLGNDVTDVIYQQLGGAEQPSQPSSSPSPSPSDGPEQGVTLDDLSIQLIDIESRIGDIHDILTKHFK